MEIIIGDWCFKRVDDGTVRVWYRGLSSDTTLIMGVDDWNHLTTLLNRSPEARPRDPRLEQLLQRVGER